VDSLCSRTCLCLCEGTNIMSEETIKIYLKVGKLACLGLAC
jgi:hypothetical protein